MQYITTTYFGLAIDKKIAAKIVIMIALLGVYDWVSMKKNIIKSIEGLPLAARWAIYLFIILVIVVFGTYGPEYVAADFIYFQF